MHACRCDEINGGQEQCVYVVNATSLIWVTSNLMQIHAFVTELEEQSKIHRMRQQQQQPAPSTIAMASRIIFWRRHRHLNSLSPRSLSISLSLSVSWRTASKRMAAAKSLRPLFVRLESSGFLFHFHTHEGARTRRKNRLISTMNVTRPQY